jgi:CubicO group peptidase (beta-lactamase class C family)
MQLRDAGKLRLDDPVSKYLPWFRMKPAEGDDTEVTIEALVTHGSGLPREAGSHWSDFRFPDAAEVKRVASEGRAVYPPDTRFKYSNLAYTIAAMVVEAVSGEPFAAYVQAHIYDPLGMTASSIDRDVPGLAVGYGRRMPDGTRAKMPFIDARAMAGATGVTSTVEDMAKFVSSQFQPRILSRGAQRQMHRVRLLENNWQTGYAVGFSVRRFQDRVYVGHGGSYPGYKTQTYIQLDDKVGVIVLTNGDDAEPGAIADQLLTTVGAAVARASAATKTPVWDPAWGRFAGLYRSGNSDTRVVEMNKELITMTPNGATASVQGKLRPVGDGTFRLEGPAGGAAVGEIVRFLEENGRVVRMVTGGGSYSQRVE